MIHSVHSSLESFKEQTFKPGLNVLLANKSEGASDKQTRNGAGKSSFIEIVHFLLGGSADTKSLFRTEALRDYRFGMSFDLNGQPVTVERTGDKYGKVWVSAESFEGWPFKPPVKGGAITANASAELTRLAEKLGAAIRSVVGPRKIIGVPFGTHASRVAAIGIPSVVFGPGDIAQAHTKDEWIEIDQLHKATEIYYQFCAAGG